MRYIVYDTETSGLNTTFDQIFQLAAVLADDNLNEIDSFVMRCRRLPHIVPSPDALLVTGVRPVDLEQADLYLLPDDDESAPTARRVEPVGSHLSRLQFHAIR